MLKAGYRYGNSAPVAVIELVDRDESVKGVEGEARSEAMKEAAATELGLCCRLGRANAPTQRHPSLFTLAQDPAQPARPPLPSGERT